MTTWYLLRQFAFLKQAPTGEHRLVWRTDPTPHSGANHMQGSNSANDGNEDEPDEDEPPINAITGGDNAEISSEAREQLVGILSAQNDTALNAFLAEKKDLQGKLLYTVIRDKDISTARRIKNLLSTDGEAVDAKRLRMELESVFIPNIKDEIKKVLEKKKGVRTRRNRG